jgi:hypothetical protein
MYQRSYSVINRRRSLLDDQQLVKFRIIVFQNIIGFFIITLWVLRWWLWHVRGLISIWLIWGPVDHHDLGNVCYRKWRHLKSRVRKGRQSRDRKWRHRKWRYFMKNPIIFWKTIIRFCFGNLYTVMYFM